MKLGPAPPPAGRPLFMHTRHGHRAYLGVGRSFFSSNIILHEYADVRECAEYYTRFTLLKKRGLITRECDTHTGLISLLTDVIYVII